MLRKAIKPPLYVVQGKQKDEESLFVENVASLLNGSVHREEDLLGTFPWESGSKPTLVLAHGSKESVTCAKACLSICRDGGRLCALIVEADALYIGPIRSATVRGACSECLSGRIKQWRHPEFDVAKPRRAGIRTLTSSDTTALARIVAGLLQYTLSIPEDPTLSGQSWILNIDSLECSPLHVVKINCCSLCAELDSLPLPLVHGKAIR
jgi:bacteriocin biosynthesis cyclodehydratase domain-containing protein